MELAPEAPVTRVTAPKIDLSRLGVNHVAYVKPGVVNGVNGFTIYAADGTPVAMAADRVMADAAIMQSNMHQVSVH
ncbi:MAG: DUF1150 family protein [Alphaproteobacteria bacterium]|nr:MAG: DUF1150 family protein [Alphaproteobacteria bacterium]